jgi:linoleoyl-CoA desaturase
MKAMAKFRIKDNKNNSPELVRKCCSTSTENSHEYGIACHNEKLESSKKNQEPHAEYVAEKINIREEKNKSTIYQECAKYIKNNGVWQRNVLIEWLLICLLLFIFAMAASLLYFCDMPILATLILSLGHTLTGWKSHDISHEPWRRNSVIRWVYMTMFGGFAPRWWRQKHNAYHHCYPNMIDVDEDFNTSPILMQCMSNKWLHQFQHMYHWIPFSLLKWSWRIEAIPEASMAELFCFLLHYSIGFYLFGVKIFIISIFIDGEIAAAITTLNHDAEEKSNLPGDFMKQTLQTTIDIDVPWGMGWLFGNMQYQTLHHLFPYIPSFRYGKLSPIIKKYCEEQGLEYRTVTMWQAWWNHKKYYYDVVRKPIVGSITQEPYCPVDNCISKKVL